MPITWQQVTRESIKRAGKWKPCICIQGGGARGAWEAGVLAGLLASPLTSTPVAIWGTSAGALNAMWTATLGEGIHPNRLLKLWCKFAARIRCVVFASILLSIGLAVALIILVGWCVAGIAAFSIVSVFLALVHIGFIDRMPGLIPTPMAGRLLLQRPEGPARMYAYFCSADVSVAKPPATWDDKSLGLFVMEPLSYRAHLLNNTGLDGYDPRTAAMSSAAMPIGCRPFRVGKMLLLDGGLEANLPAGFILANGTLGGNCIICIMPQPLKLLNQREHVGYRVLRFLYDLREEQAHHRIRASNHRTGALVCPPCTFMPALLVTPRKMLRSGLMCGFFFPSILKKEFELGRHDAQVLLRTMTDFENGRDDALDAFLLDHQILNIINGEVPTPPWWAIWANKKWLD